MNKLDTYISSQFGNPRGFVGKIITLAQNMINKDMYKGVLACLELGERDSLLDIGYGNGHLLELIYKKTGADLYGIDISADAKDMTIKRNKAADADGKLHLEVGDCCNLPYADSRFQAVTSINTVYFWEDTVAGLKEIRRVLKEGASFYNVVYSKEYLNHVKYTEVGYKKFEREELISYGKEAGFREVRIQEIAKGKSYIVIYQK